MQQPLGFIDSSRQSHVCTFYKFIRGLKQALRAWFECLSNVLFGLGFQSNHPLIYVNDVIFIGNNSIAIQEMINILALNFP